MKAEIYNLTYHEAMLEIDAGNTVERNDATRFRIDVNESFIDGSPKLYRLDSKGRLLTVGIEWNQGLFKVVL